MAIKLPHCRLFHKFCLLGGQSLSLARTTSTTSSTRRAEAIFIENNPLEVPVIAITDKDNVDLIGPPDALSNLRPIVRRRHVCETELQQMLREVQDETQAWNQKFWAEHNTRFLQQRKEFVMQTHEAKGCTETLNAEEMSIFYKKFLDDNWNNHIWYNIAWYKRNMYILWLAMRASLPPSFHFIGNLGNTETTIRN